MIEETPNLPDEDIVEIEGVLYCRVVSKDWTISDYYGHSTEKGPGPGWDNRAVLLDPKFTEPRFNKTFTEEEVYGPGNLPDNPMVFLEKMGSREAK